MYGGTNSISIRRSFVETTISDFCSDHYLGFMPVAPVVQVVNLEFYLLCSSPGFEPQVGRTFDFICKNKNKNDSIVESALQRG